MKLKRSWLALLLALALCLGLTGCASDSGASQEENAGNQQGTEQDTEPDTEQETEQGTEQEPSVGDTGDTDTEPPADDEPFTGFERFTVEDLTLTQIDDTIATIQFASCNGQTLIAPVFLDANWDNAQIAEDKTFVEVTNTDGSALTNLDGVYYCTYFSEEQEYYDLDDMAQQYSDVFEEAEIYPKTASEDGSAQAVAVHGKYQGNEIYQYMVTIDCGEEYTVMDLSFYTSDATLAEPLLSYWGLPNPAVS